MGQNESQEVYPLLTNDADIEARRRDFFDPTIDGTDNPVVSNDTRGAIRLSELPNVAETMAGNISPYADITNERKVVVPGWVRETTEIPIDDQPISPDSAPLTEGERNNHHARVHEALKRIENPYIRSDISMQETAQMPIVSPHIAHNTYQEVPYVPMPPVAIRYSAKNEYHT